MSGTSDASFGGSSGSGAGPGSGKTINPPVGGAGAGPNSGEGGSGGEATELPDFGVPTDSSAQEFVRVSWNARRNARYSLDVRPSGEAYVGPCVGDTVLGERLSYVFDGRCPSAGAMDIRSFDSVRLCSSVPETGDVWNPDTVECTEVSYTGGSSLHIDTPRDDDGLVVLRWPELPGASFALHVELENGELIDNCASSLVLGEQTSYAFDGTCPSAKSAPGLDQIARFQIDAALGGNWELASARRSASISYDGTAHELNFEFPGFTNHYFDESCGRLPEGDLEFGKSSLDAEVCAATHSSFLKRRYFNRQQTKIMAYPRSYEAADGTKYVLFATPGGGFTPAGQTGCSELNLIATRDWKTYTVTQIERLCGYTRLDNGELTVIDGKMYVAYHTISGEGGCSAEGDVPGREWQLRMKVSDDFANGQATFTNLLGEPGHEVLRELCLPNASNDGFWEPMIYQAENGAFQVAYTDDTPPEINDGKCNQFLRVLTYSLEDREVTADVPVGNCPGDKRDGMPVVARRPDGTYFMALESLGPPSSQILLLTSEDGGLTFPNRQVVADVADDGGYGVGCPYVVFDGDKPFVSYYHAFTAKSGASFGAFRVLGLNADLSRRSDQIVELRRRWNPTDSVSILYWGGIRLMGDHLHLVGAAWGAGANWGHPFTEAWVPTL